MDGEGELKQEKAKKKTCEMTITGEKIESYWRISTEKSWEIGKLAPNGETGAILFQKVDFSFSSQEFG